MKSREAREVPISSLVFDGELYPRLKIDPTNVRQLAEKIESGIELDPLVIEAKTMRIVDGVHRWKAYQRLEIEKTKCLIFEYVGDQELFAHAAKLNFHHGAKLNRADIAMIVSKMLGHGMKEEEIQNTLGISRESFEHLKANFGYRRAEAKHEGPGTIDRRVFLKANMVHLQGKKLSEKQIAGHDHIIGLQQVAIINQVINLIENDLLDFENEKALERLKHLHELIEERILESVKN